MQLRKLPHFKFLTQVIFLTFFSHFYFPFCIYLTVTIWREEVHLKILCKWMKIPFMTLCQCFYSSREVQQKRKEEGGGGNDKFFIFLKTENGCSKTSLTRKLHLKYKKKFLNFWHISREQTKGLHTWRNLWRNLCIDNHLSRTLTEMQKWGNSHKKFTRFLPLYSFCLVLERDSGMNKVSVGYSILMAQEQNHPLLSWNLTHQSFSDTVGDLHSVQKSSNENLRFAIKNFEM